MSDDTTGTFAEADQRPLLSWEDLGAQPASRAFRRGLKELLFSPRAFFDKMATSGGLREPLMFFWIGVTVAILLSFPLALSYFALTAPDPLDVATEVYNRHLLTPRVAGFVTVLLPLVLVVAGLLVVLAGSLFHVGARLFGAGNWEGSVSIWCYAKSAGLAPLVAAEAVACVVSIGCYLVTLAWPGAKGDVVSVVRLSTWLLGAGGSLCACVLFIAALVVGCTRTWQLEAATGAAAALAGIVTLMLITVGTGLCYVFWGIKGGLPATTAAVALIVILLVTQWAGAGEAEATSRPSGTA